MTTDERVDEAGGAAPGAAPGTMPEGGTSAPDGDKRERRLRRQRALRYMRIGLVAGRGLAAAYFRVARPWMRGWGATRVERDAGLPGDDLLPQPWLETTRAVTIQAPVEAIWPWLAQMGDDRAGWYGFRRLEGTKPADRPRIVAEWQHLAPGDVLRSGAAGFLGRVTPGEAGEGFQVAILAPPDALVLRARDADGGHRGPPIAVWAFVLRVVDAHHTRLIERVRLAHRPPRGHVLLYPLVEPLDFLQNRRHLRNVRTLAERGASPPDVRSRRLREFLRERFNPRVLRFAGRTSAYGVIYHLGRHSGKEYTTPVAPYPTGDGFLVPLPYGVDADWCRNVRAAGHCRMLLHGVVYELDEPVVLDAPAALAAYPRAWRLAYRVTGCRHWLRLHTFRAGVAAATGGAAERETLSIG